MDEELDSRGDEEFESLLASVSCNDPDLLVIEPLLDFSAVQSEFTGSLKGSTVVHSLFLSWNGIGDDTVQLLAKVLKANGTIHTVDLSDNQINVAGAVALAEALKCNQTIKEVYLCSNCIQSGGAIALSEALKQNNVLRILYLRSNKICLRGAEALADMLKQNCGMRKMCLAGNAFGEAGTIAFAKALEKNSALDFLELDSAPISKSIVLALATTLERNCTLRILSLKSGLFMHWSTEFSTTFAKALRRNISIEEIGEHVPSNEIRNLLWRNEDLSWSVADGRMQSLFLALHAAIGSDVYTILLIIDCLPYFSLLKRLRKVALLQSLEILWMLRRANRPNLSEFCDRSSYFFYK